MYLLGLRRMELAGLQWSDVHETAEGPALWIRTTKGADQRAALPLSAPALECLDRLRALRPAPQSGPARIHRRGEGRHDQRVGPQGGDRGRSGPREDRRAPPAAP